MAGEEGGEGRRGGRITAARWGFNQIMDNFRNNRLWQVAGIIVLIAIILAFIVPGRRGPLRAPIPGRSPLQIIAFFENGWGGMHTDSFPALKEHYRTIDVVTAFWYSIGPDGKIVEDRTRKEVIDFVKGNGLRMEALFNNKKIDDNAAFLKSAETRLRAIDAIVATVNKFGFQGVNIDFERIPPQVEKGLTTFVTDLRAKLPQGVSLSVSVFPKIDVAKEIQGAYNYSELAKHADYLVLMLYDKHYEGGPPGPVSPLDWVKANLEYAINQGIPSQKLVLAMGAYGYDWEENNPQSKTEYVPLQWCLRRAEQYGVPVQWDEQSQNAFFHYTKDGVQHILWFQNKETIRQRIKLAKQYNLRGVALWRLGFEDPDTWAVIREELSRP